MTNTEKHCNSLITVIFWSERWIKEAIWNSFTTSFVCGLFFFLFSTCATYCHCELNFVICCIIDEDQSLCLQEQMSETQPFQFLYLLFLLSWHLWNLLFCFSVTAVLSSAWRPIFVMMSHISARRKIRFSISSKNVARNSWRVFVFTTLRATQVHEYIYWQLFQGRT